MKKENKTPKISGKTRMSILVKDELHGKLKRMALEYDISISKMVTQILTNHIKTYDRLYEQMTSQDFITEITKTLVAEQKEQSEKE